MHIRSLVRAFQGQGHEVFEVSLVRQVGRAPKDEEAQPRNGWSLMDRVPRFARELAEYAYGGVAKNRILRAARDVEPDFLYERYAFGNAGGVQAAERLGLPIVLEVNSPMVLELSRTRGLSFPRAARRIEEFIFRSAHVICPVTGVLADMLCEMGVERERVLVTPNGVDLERYVAAADGEARRRSARGPPRTA